MADDRARAQAVASATPVTGPETSRREEAEDDPYAEVERVEDTVPYLPLPSYPVQILITHIGPGAPHIYPDELLEEDV